MLNHSSPRQRAQTRKNKDTELNHLRSNRSRITSTWGLITWQPRQVDACEIALGLPQSQPFELLGALCDGSCFPTSTCCGHNYELGDEQMSVWTIRPSRFLSLLPDSTLDLLHSEQLRFQCHQCGKNSLRRTKIILKSNTTFECHKVFYSQLPFKCGYYFYVGNTIENFHIENSHKACHRWPFILVIFWTRYIWALSSSNNALRSFI